MIQLALSVADSSASTLHANPRGAPGLSQQSRLLTESKPKYISTCSQLILQRKSKQVGNHPSISLSGGGKTRGGTHCAIASGQEGIQKNKIDAMALVAGH